MTTKDAEQKSSSGTRNLVLLLGDQHAAADKSLRDFRSDVDVVLQVEAREEATYVAQHKLRLTLFFSAMRHTHSRLVAEGINAVYRKLDDAGNCGSIAQELERAVRAFNPASIVVTKPGDHRVEAALHASCKRMGVPLNVRADPSFFDSPEGFTSFASPRKRLRQEDYYRHLRKRENILMSDGKPVQGRWNFDQDNRGSFGRQGPGLLPPVSATPPSEVTLEVSELVAREFPDAPGDVMSMDYPVTPDDALKALDDFIENRLESFGRYQDAMATDEPYLYHSRLSAAINLHLLTPRLAVARAVAAFEEGRAPLASVEGFVRQILGWREYVRGIYWQHMPTYESMNFLSANAPVPNAYWTGETEMNCVRQSMRPVLKHAYAHHIQRLMVLGLYAMLFGVDPLAMHRWHMAMYIDAVDWVSLPNVLGMSQFGDGGIVGSKPYCASGNYINRMSDYCRGCRFNAANATGDEACPVTTLYWDFLERNKDVLRSNPRMGFQYKNLANKSSAEISAIQNQADSHRAASY